MDYFVHQSGGHENIVGFVHRDLQNHIEAQHRDKIKDGDAKGALGYLSAKAEVDPLFFFTYTMDKKNRLD